MTQGSELVQMFTNDEGLPEPVETDWSDAVEGYRMADLVEGVMWFAKGYRASCVSLSYGEASLEEFAKEVDTALRIVQRQRRVYLRLRQIQNTVPGPFLEPIQNGQLGLSHVDIAARLKNDDDFADMLLEAADNEYGKRELAEHVAIRKALEEPDVDKAPEPHRNGQDEGDVVEAIDEPKEITKAEAGRRWARMNQKVLTIAGGLEGYGVERLAGRWPEQNKRLFAEQCRKLAGTFTRFAEQLEALIKE